MKTDVPWAIVFSDPNSLAPQGIPLHPTQIYLSINAVIIFSILVWLRKRKSFDGQIIWAYGVLYSIGRFIIEYFRGDDRGYAVESLFSTSQFIGILIFGISVFMLITMGRNRTGPSLSQK